MDALPFAPASKQGSNNQNNKILSFIFSPEICQAIFFVLFEQFRH